MRDKFFLPITLLVCGIIFFCWYNFFYETTQREIASTEMETRRLREVEREILELKARYENLTALVELKEQQLDAARNFLPSTLEQDKFIDVLYRSAELCGVQLMSVQTGEEISAQEVQTQIVTVKLETDYISLLNFIRESLDGGRLVSLEKFSVNSAGDKILLCELNFKIFAESLPKKQS